MLSAISRATASSALRGAHLDAARAVDCREADLGQIEVLGDERQEVLALDQHRATYALLPARMHPRLVRSAGIEEQGVELGEVLGLRDRTQWFRRKIPISFSTPPFSCACEGLQNSDSICEWERKAMMRAVSSRRMPRSIRLTADARLS